MRVTLRSVAPGYRSPTVMPPEAGETTKPTLGAPASARTSTPKGPQDIGREGSQNRRRHPPQGCAEMAFLPILAGHPFRPHLRLTESTP